MKETLEDTMVYTSELRRRKEEQAIAIRMTGSNFFIEGKEMKLDALK